MGEIAVEDGDDKQETSSSPIRIPREAARGRANPRFIESKYSLRSQHPELYRLDLTEDQKRILNSWSYFGGPRPDVLTEQQNRILTEQEKESMPLRVLKWLRSQ